MRGGLPRGSHENCSHKKMWQVGMRFMFTSECFPFALVHFAVLCLTSLPPTVLIMSTTARNTRKASLTGYANGLSAIVNAHILVDHCEHGKLQKRVVHDANQAKVDAVTATAMMTPRHLQPGSTGASLQPKELSLAVAAPQAPLPQDMECLLPLAPPNHHLQTPGFFPWVSMTMI